MKGKVFKNMMPLLIWSALLVIALITMPDTTYILFTFSPFSHHQTIT